MASLIGGDGRRRPESSSPQPMDSCSIGCKNGKLFKNVGDNGIVDLKTEWLRNTEAVTRRLNARDLQELAIILHYRRAGRYGIAGDPRLRPSDRQGGLEISHVLSRVKRNSVLGIDGWQDRRGPGMGANDSGYRECLVFVPLGNATDQKRGNVQEEFYATA